MVGGRKAFYRLLKEERESLTDTAKQMYDIGADYIVSMTMATIDRRGFVYVITHPSWPGYVKIGRAFDPEERLKGYQTGCPLRQYKLNYAVYFHDCFHAEQEIHARLDVCRAEGEWFHTSAAIAANHIDNLRELL